MNRHFTRVEIAFYPEYLNHWLRFGTEDEWLDLDRRRALAFFEPGRIFGHVRWRANLFGTREWRFTIIHTAMPGKRLSRVPGVLPGGEILLQASGGAAVKRALKEIDRLEMDGFEPADVSPSYYRHVHNRLVTRSRIRTYSHDQHAAWQALRRVLP